MSIASAKILGNGLLLVGALLFIGLLLIGPRQISLIDEWGDRWLIAYLESHSNQFRVLIESVRKGQTDQAINDLQTKWQDVQKRDYIYRFKRHLLLALATELHRQERYQELLYWSSEWMTLDGRDIDAVAFWHEALYRSADRKTEGFDGLHKAWNLFPDNVILTRFFLLSLKDQLPSKKEMGAQISQMRQSFIKEQTETVLNKTHLWEIFLYSNKKDKPVNDQDFENYVDSRRDLTQSWALINDYLSGGTLNQYPNQHGLTPAQQAKYWIKEGASSKALFGRLHFVTNDNAQRVSQKLRLVLVTDNKNWSRLFLQITPDTDTLRIDPPADLTLQIEKVRLRTDAAIYDIPLSQIEFNNMELIDGSLRTTENPDPHFFIQVKNYLEDIQIEEKITLELTAQLVTAMGNIALAEFSSGSFD
jgi:hypothetical protein